MKTNQSYFFPIILCLAITLSSCGGAEATQQPPAVAATADPTETTQPTPTAAPTQVPVIPCNIVFESDRDGNLEIYSMGPDGSNPQNLSNNPEVDFRPVWSPDGTKIAFTSRRVTPKGGDQHIFVMNADGTGLTQISFDFYADWPDWSNDSKNIVYSNDQDIFITDLTGKNKPTNLTNDDMKDSQPKWSPDGTKIAWSSSKDGQYWDIYVMNSDGSDVKQITNNGKNGWAKWTNDNRLFTGWGWKDEEPTCNNCISSVDTLERVEGGGKGELVKFFPFVTLSGDRVELVSFDNFEGNFEIYALGGSLPDTLNLGIGNLNLTNNPTADTSPHWPAQCIPPLAHIAASNESPTAQPPADPNQLVFGYEAAENNMTPRMEQDLLKACDELKIRCVKSDDMLKLAEQKVDAILSFSGRWHVNGAWPKINQIAKQGIPLFMLNAESPEPGVYNLSNEWVATTATLDWMFKEMGDSGEFVYYNFGDNSIHKDIINQALKDHPSVKGTSMPANYDKQELNEESIVALVNGNPNIKAVWSTEWISAIFWGLKVAKIQTPPAIIMEPSKEMFQAWQGWINENPSARGIATIKPGGTGYEGVYVAYYLLNGVKIDPAMLTGAANNTFSYDTPIITNENLSEWLLKTDSLRTIDRGILELPPMTPAEIKEKWFLE
jgi:ABC-type sugar transport system substrate-binding protein